VSERVEQVSGGREGGGGEGGRGGGGEGARGRTRTHVHALSHISSRMMHMLCIRQNGYAALLANICEGVVGVGTDTTRLLRLFGRV
jgi:hypothetical protein